MNDEITKPKSRKPKKNKRNLALTLLTAHHVQATWFTLIREGGAFSENCCENRSYIFNSWLDIGLIFINASSKCFLPTFNPFTRFFASSGFFALLICSRKASITAVFATEAISAPVYPSVRFA